MEYRLKRRSGSKYWYITWTENGETKRLSTRQTDKDAARRELIDFEREMALPGAASDVTVRQAAAYYLSVINRPSTSKRQQYALKSPLAFFGDMRPDQIDRRACRAYIAMRAQAGRKPSAIINELSALAAALNCAARDGVIARAPYIERPAAPPARERWLSREEADRLLDAAGPVPHLRLFIELALRTAARTSAILGLTWDRVDFEQGTIDYRDPALAAEKKKRRAVVPMNLSLREALLSVEERKGHVIQWGGHRVGSVKKAFAEACRRAGLRDVTPHTLRHTAATWMAMAGVDMRQISLLLGHTSILVTERVYAKYHPSYLRSAVEALENKRSA
jgi:integrase